jgi:hypothetical protein
MVCKTKSGCEEELRKSVTYSDATRGAGGAGARAGVGVRRCWSTAGGVGVVFSTVTTSSIEASEWKVVVVETTITGSIHVGIGSAGGAAAARRASIAASGL